MRPFLTFALTLVAKLSAQRFLQGVNARRCFVNRTAVVGLSNSAQRNLGLTFGPQKDSNLSCQNGSQMLRLAPRVSFGSWRISFASLFLKPLSFYGSRHWKRRPVLDETRFSRPLCPLQTVDSDRAKPDDSLHFLQQSASIYRFLCKNASAICLQTGIGADTGSAGATFTQSQFWCLNARGRKTYAPLGRCTACL